MLIILDGCFSQPLYLNLPNSTNNSYEAVYSHALSNFGLDLHQFSIYHNDNLITDKCLFNNITPLSPSNESFCVLHVQCRINGGKGGFGSMLKAIGAQIERTTNHEACRDLNGRRLRDIHAEKAHKKWNREKSKREFAREKRLAEKREKRWSEVAPPKFNNTHYLNELNANSENIEAALQHAQSSKIKNKKRLNNNPHNNSKVVSKKLKSVYNKFYEDNLSDAESNSDNDSNEKYNSFNEHRKLSHINNKDNGCSSTNLININKIDTTAPMQNNNTQTSIYTNPSCSTNSDDFTSVNTHSISPVSIISDSHTDNTSTHIISEYSNNNDADVSTSQEILISKPTAVTTKEDSDSINSTSSSPEESTPLDINSIHTRQSLEELSLAQLKVTLQQLGLKCGGTLDERVDRLWLYKTTPKDKLPSSILAGKANSKKQKK